MPEGNPTGGEPDEQLIPLAGRIELLGLTLGIGDTAELVDPDEEDSERAPGVEIVPLVTLDLSGHLHRGGQCMETITPYLLTSRALDNLIDGLIEIRGVMDERYPDRERGSQE